MLLEKKCHHCGDKFQRQLSPSNIKAGRGKFCGRECAAQIYSQRYKNGEIILELKNLELGRRGRKQSKITREKIAKSLLGKNGGDSRNWRGGITPANKLARKTIEYQLWREFVFNRDNYTCQICGERGGKLRANHIKKFSDYPELRTKKSNGVTICENCDLVWVLHREPSWESYFNFNLSTRDTALGGEKK